MYGINITCLDKICFNNFHEFLTNNLTLEIIDPFQTCYIFKDIFKLKPLNVRVYETKF